MVALNSNCPGPCCNTLQPNEIVVPAAAELADGVGLSCGAWSGGYVQAMQSLQEAVDWAAERTRFSGVIRLDLAGDTEFCKAYGAADRSHGILNTVQTLFATASGSKGLTALAVMSLVERGALALDWHGSAGPRSGRVSSARSRVEVRRAMALRAQLPGVQPRVRTWGQVSRNGKGEPWITARIPVEKQGV